MVARPRKSRVFTRRTRVVGNLQVACMLLGEENDMSASETLETSIAGSNVC